MERRETNLGGHEFAMLAAQVPQKETIPEPITAIPPALWDSLAHMV